MTIIQAIIIAIIEGLTEFLPISSTGHMIIANSLLGIQEDAFVKLYTVVIQLGAILSVVAIYWKKFFTLSRLNFYIKLLIAVIPALIFGFIFGDYIDTMLEKPLPIGIIFVLGGIVLLFIDNYFKKPTIKTEEDIHSLSALKIGLFQVLAIIFPGLSRSAATIIGGLTQKLNRETAAEFSFFLAVPTMAAATGYKLLKAALDTPEMLKENISLLIIGNVVAFAVAIVAIRTFIGFVTKNGFRYFGVYRIIVGLLVIILCLFKVIG
jgi:undecaprenyl-diphosphatase